MNNINIGSKIREFRLSKGLSLKALAESAGVSSSLLSQIEKGSANPSINTIKNIADILETPLFLFFKEEVPRDSFIVRRGDRKTMSFSKGEEASYELLTPDLSGEIEFMMLNLQPGAESSQRRREHRGEEVAYILDGSVKLYLEGEEFILHQGDSARINSYMKHRWKNEGGEGARIIFAINLPCF